MSVPKVRFDVAGPHGSWTLTLDTGRVAWIGRDSDVEIPLSAANVSRRHVSVEWTKDGFRVTDTSANGTLVDGDAMESLRCSRQ